MKEVKTSGGYNIQIYDSIDYSMFPDRKELTKREVKDADGEMREVSVTILQKEKMYSWMRIFIDNEVGSKLSIKKGDVVKMHLTPFNETLTTTFATFEKKGLYKDNDDIVNYESEVDTGIMCVMIDNDELYELENMRQIFSWSKYYEPSIIRKDEIVFEFSDGTKMEYISLGL